MAKEVEFIQNDFNFLHYCDMQMKQEKDGSIYMEAVLRREFLNPYGMAHGGYLATMADTVGGANAARFMDKPLTLDYHMEYFRNVSEGTLTARAKIVKMGHKIAVMRVEITCREGLMAEATITYFNSAQ